MVSRKDLDYVANPDSDAFRYMLRGTPTAWQLPWVVRQRILIVSGTPITPTCPLNRPGRPHAWLVTCQCSIRLDPVRTQSAVGDGRAFAVAVYPQWARSAVNDSFTKALWATPAGVTAMTELVGWLPLSGRNTRGLPSGLAAAGCISIE